MPQMFKKIKPHNLLGVIGLLLFTVSFLVPSHTVDVNIHDTYYVLEMSYAFRNVACFFLVLFTIYTFLQQKLYSPVLSWAHVSLTVLTATVCFFFLYRASEAYQPNFSNWESFQTNNHIIVITLLIFLLAQLLLLVNLLIGAFRRQRDSTPSYET
jgi:hypothetical protein